MLEVVLGPHATVAWHEKQLRPKWRPSDTLSPKPQNSEVDCVVPTCKAPRKEARPMS